MSTQKMDELSVSEVPFHAAAWMRENRFDAKSVKGVKLAKAIAAARKIIEEQYAAIDAATRELQSIATQIEQEG